MSAGDDRDVTWPSMAAGGQARPVGPSWPRANDQVPAPLPPRPVAQPRPWLPAALWLVCGIVIGSILTLVMLFVAGPRPVALPTPTGAGQMTVTMNDAFLTTAMRQAANNMPVVGGVGSLTAHAVVGDRILLTGSNADGGSSDAAVSMTLQPFAHNGVLSAHVLDARFGGLPLPAVLDAQVESAINSQLAALGQSALAGSHYTITSVTTANGQVILTLGAAS